MTFGQKIKKLRQDNNMTQEQLAYHLYVTRTAISKWETDKGFPAIDSLKMISNLFDISLDELISDGDIDTKRALDKKHATIFYAIAMCFLVAATIFSLFAYFLKQPLLNIGSSIAVLGYVIFGLLSKPRYVHHTAKRIVLPYMISRAVILLFVIGLMIYTFVTI